MKIALLFLLTMVLASCTTFRQVASIQEVEENERVLVGILLFEGVEKKDLDPIGGAIGNSLLFSYENPVQGDELKIIKQGDEVRNVSLKPEGSLIKVATAQNKPAYFTGIRLKTTVVLANVYRFIAIPVQIEPSSGRCDYIGTIVFKKGADGKSGVEVRDEWDEDHEDLEKKVEGCRLTKNLAKPIPYSKVDRGGFFERLAH